MKFILAVLCFIVCQCNFAAAQLKISPGEIKKIHLIDGEWALGFSRLTEFDLLPEDGQWNCYLTHQKYQEASLEERKTNYLKKDAERGRFVNKVDTEIVDGLLKTISAMKPNYNWQIYGIDADTVATTVDTVYLKTWEKKMSAMNHLIFVNELKKTSNIKAAIDSLQHYWWTDDVPVCSIDIIKRNNDTVKISTQKQMDYMLPWLVNNSPSYDLNINKFYIAATGEFSNSNRSRVAGDGFLYKIQEYIYSNFATEPIIRYEWNKSSPKQYKLLNSLFNLSELSYGNEGIIMQAKSNDLPRNFEIYDEIKMGDQPAIAELTRFKNRLVPYIKKGNFVFDYYKDIPKAFISFSLRYNLTGNLAQYNAKFKAWLQKNDSTIYNERTILRFSAGTQFWDSQDWLLLPDNRLILLSYFNAKIAGVTYKALETGDETRKDCFILFDSKENIISENP